MGEAHTPMLEHTESSRWYKVGTLCALVRRGDVESMMMVAVVPR